MPNRAAAASTNIVIYQLQTGSSSAATEEFISVYNNNPYSWDVTGWCITKSSSSDATQAQLGCIVSPEPNVKIMLPSHAFLTLGTNEFIVTHTGFTPDIVFNANLATASGHIRVLDRDKQEIDRLGWGTAVHPEGTSAPAHASGKILQRQIEEGFALKDTDNNSNDFAQTILPALVQSSLYEEEIPTDLCGNINGLQATLPPGFLFDQSGNCQQDVCSNVDLLQIDVPDGYVSELDGTCSLVPLEGATLVISELLPNVTSYDTGKEFIEIYNPNDRAIDLKGYVLQLGPSFAISYTLPDQTILPGAYMSFSDSITNLVLSNTSASLRLVAPNGNVVSEAEMYLSPVENMAWALLGTTWQYTNQPTPGAANVGSLEESSAGDAEIKTLAPCPAGQYRSSDTNRCRLLQTAVSGITPCKAGQERNPETNRCRTSVLGAITSLMPCKAGQERNAETNRCKTVSSSTLAPCDEGQQRNAETNRCRKTGSPESTLAKVQDVATNQAGVSVRWWIVGAAIAVAIGYGAYEWRQDVINLIHKRRAKKITN